MPNDAPVIVRDRSPENVAKRWLVVRFAGLSWTAFAERINAFATDDSPTVDLDSDHARFNVRVLKRIVPQTSSLFVAAYRIDDDVFAACTEETPLSNFGRLLRQQPPVKHNSTGGRVTNGAFFRDPMLLLEPPGVAGATDVDWKRAEGDVAFAIEDATSPAEVFVDPELSQEHDGQLVGFAQSLLNSPPEKSAAGLVLLDETKFESYQSEAEPAGDEQPAITTAIVADALGKHKNVLLDGVAGSGKTHLREELEAKYPGRSEFVVFHPSTAYEDFVRGMRPNFDADDDNSSPFVIADGLFVEMCEKAWQNPGNDYLLFIDELNRANTARVLGDLLFAMEKSKRVDAADAGGECLTAVRHDGSVRLQIADNDHPAFLRVPTNLHILGTMNSTDRSVGTLDLALQRRFHRLSSAPMTRAQLDSALREQGGVTPAVPELDGLLTWYETLNERLAEFVGPDARVGHAYFFKGLPETKDEATAYVHGVVSSALAQVAEVTRAFAVDRQTLANVMSGLDFTLEMVGDGLGEMPVTTAATPPVEAAPEHANRRRYLDLPTPDDAVRKNLYDAIVATEGNSRLRAAFELLGYNHTATFTTLGGREISVRLPLEGRDLKEATERLRIEFREGGRPDVIAAQFNRLMWGGPLQFSWSERLPGALRNQFLNNPRAELTQEARAHLETVCELTNDAHKERPSASSGRGIGTYVAAALERHKNVLLEGVAGCGKSYMLGELAKEYEGNYDFVVFHPSSTYEDFVRGLRPVVDVEQTGGREFEIVDGVFIELCERAWQSPEQKFLLFIDEINRANTARVLGDLLCVIEDSKRVDALAAPDADQHLTYEARPNSVRLLISDEETHPAYLRVPSNLHILGTMNSTDRSVGSLDLALQRRFFRIAQSPLVGDALAEAVVEKCSADSLDEDFKTVIEWHEGLNKRLRVSIGPDAELGHSYFFPDENGDLPSLTDVSEAVFAQLIEIVRIFAAESKVEGLTPVDGAAAHPSGWHLTVAGDRLGRMPVLRKTATDDQ